MRVERHTTDLSFIRRVPQSRLAVFEATPQCKLSSPVLKKALINPIETFRRPLFADSKQFGNLLHGVEAPGLRHFEVDVPIAITHQEFQRQVHALHLRSTHQVGDARSPVQNSCIRSRRGQ